MPSIIDDDVIIGFKSVISEGVIIQRGAYVGPNSVVPPGKILLAGE
jgi:carbonic anhydrase/acetyltransferase-like protein (isoleucine patch superfamily)